MGRMDERGRICRRYMDRGASGRVHRHVQSAYNPRPAAARKGVGVGQERGGGRRQGIFDGRRRRQGHGMARRGDQNALRRGRGEYRGVAIARLDD